MKYFLAFLFFTFSISIYAQNTIKLDSLANFPKSNLESISWISGYWVGEAMGGAIEEIWSEPLGDSMMGSFKLVIDGKVKFYELCTISEIEGSFILRIKHFNNDLKGWEEKNETQDFALVKVEEHRAYFNGLTFEKTKNNGLNIYVIVNSENGKDEELKFSYKLKHE